MMIYKPDWIVCGGSALVCVRCFWEEGNHSGVVRFGIKPHRSAFLFIIIEISNYLETVLDPRVAPSTTYLSSCMCVYPTLKSNAILYIPIQTVFIYNPAPDLISLSHLAPDRLVLLETLWGAPNSASSLTVPIPCTLTSTSFPLPPIFFISFALQIPASGSS